MKLQEIKEWSDERFITNQTPSVNGHIRNIAEEAGEYLLAVINKDEYEMVDAVADNIIFNVGEIYKYSFNAEELLGKGDIMHWLPKSPGYKNHANFNYIEETTLLQYNFSEAEDDESRVRVLRDEVYASATELIRLGFCPDKVMSEVLREINSRTGAFDEEVGKWKKFKTPEAKALWVKADYSTCRID